MSDMMSRKAVYDALECMRFASDAERRYGFSLLEQIPTVEPDQFADVSKKGDMISRQQAIELAMQYCPDDDGTCSKADEDIRNLLDELEGLPSVQPEYRPVNAEDFSKTMSENTVFSFWEWHGKALELMENEGFVICKRTM